MYHGYPQLCGSSVKHDDSFTDINSSYYRSFELLPRCRHCYASSYVDRRVVCGPSRRVWTRHVVCGPTRRMWTDTSYVDRHVVCGPTRRVWTDTSCVDRHVVCGPTRRMWTDTSYVDRHVASYRAAATPTSVVIQLCHLSSRCGCRWTSSRPRHSGRSG